MLKRIYYQIAGDDASYRFEHRVFNLTSFVIMGFCIVGTILNYVFGLHIATVWLGLMGAIFSAVLFYFSRVRRWFTPYTIFGFVIACIVLLGPLHFYNGGLSGPVLYQIFMVMTILLLIAQRKHQYAIYGLLGGTMILLLVIEYAFPRMVTPYASRDQQMGDYSTVLAYVPFFTMVVIVLFRGSYDRDQKLLMQQKEKLEEAYTITKEKNEYIESLIRELHHRVKNNLQVVSALLSLQSNRLVDDEAKMALEAGKTRVDAMAMIHQKLYLDNELAAVDIEEYLANLSASLASSFGYDVRTIRTHVQLTKRSMNLDLAIPIGLIVNELVTNSFKHAFHGIDSAEIRVRLQQQPDQTLELAVNDNGAGWDASDNKESEAFGMKLVQLLVNQINGEMKIERNHGTSYSIIIPQ